MRFIVWLCLIPGALAAPQDGGAGRALFESRCAACHGGDGNGGAFGPPIVARLAARNDAELTSFLRAGVPGRGMPAFDLPGGEMLQLVAHLRSLRPLRSGGREPVRVKLETITGGSIEGLLLAEGVEDLQLSSADGRVALLRRAGARVRPVTSQTDWPHYDGGYSGNRYSALREIDRSNVSRLAVRWIFPMDETTPLQTTPIVVDGIMYATTANQCFALDAGSGRRIWHFQANDFWRASPMTYVFDRKQYVAIASGPNILSFTLPD